MTCEREFDEDFYYGLRWIARKRALDDINARILKDGGATQWNGTSLASITPEAIEFATKEWPKHYGPTTHSGFSKSWTSIVSHAQLQPSRFELAIWQEIDGKPILQGLAVGNTSHGKKHVSLNWVERNFGPDYLRVGVLVPILSCFEHYAHLVEAERALIKNPVDPHIYHRYGYKPMKLQGTANGVVFLGKELKNG